MWSATAQGTIKVEAYQEKGMANNGSQQQVVVVGSSFAGLTAALELRKHLDHVLGANDHAHVMVGPQAHWAKVAFGRFFLTSREHGMVAL